MHSACHSMGAVWGPCRAGKAHDIGVRVHSIGVGVHSIGIMHGIGVRVHGIGIRVNGNRCQSMRMRARRKTRDDNNDC